MTLYPQFMTRLVVPLIRFAAYQLVLTRPVFTTRLMHFSRAPAVFDDSASSLLQGPAIPGNENARLSWYI